ncbi:hypothetical protein AO265_17700 [Pseudomonas sp. ABAC61]|nr:hypothetical protein AO265_17700 [Pseudomonas sp. ABAC61]
MPIPPLRERGNDVLMIAGHFLELNRTRLGLRGLRLSAAAERALLGYRWPGNVRELEHVIGRAALKQLSRDGSRSRIITLECQRQCIVQALRLSGDSWAGAARLLAVDPSNLHKLARRLRLK